jgi:GT2 family glycosyltransferase
LHKNFYHFYISINIFTKAHNKNDQNNFTFSSTENPYIFFFFFSFQFKGSKIIALLYIRKNSNKTFPKVKKKTEQKKQPNQQKKSFTVIFLQPNEGCFP